MMTENKVYWRNKATFIVQAYQKKYFVTLVSTKIYYEIHIVHTHSKEPFQLGTDGRNICRKVWNDIGAVISNSLNAPLKEYTVACQCTLHGSEELEHAMEFESKPHDKKNEIKANCLLDKNRPHPLTVDTSEQSIIVWFKEPYDHQIKDLGSFIELSTDHLFMTTSSSDQLQYQWSRIINDEEEKIEDNEYFKNSNSKVMVIDGFESKYAGTYQCVISTSSRPIVSMSAEVELDIPEPPEEFSTEMSDRQFLLYLNTKGIYYDICKKLRENGITAKEFNLSSYESWSLDLNLTSIEKNALLSLLVVADCTKCAVCLNIHVDPCTLSCGHTFCQLCLAHMWKNNDDSCPVCKETWKVLPAISFDYRRNIESAHGREVERLRKEYSLEDKELIEEFLEARKTSSKCLVQQPEEISQLPDVWKLPGVEECDETSVVVQSSQGQLVEWNGLKLHIHAGSLPEGLQQCTIFIKASLAGEYEIPENTSLVSAFFWLRCEPQCTFIKPITVEIQHCSTKQDLSKLKIVRAFCNQKSLPYKFKQLKGASFNADTFYGAIDMKGFSGVCVVEENPDSERMYYNQLFYRSCLSHQRRHEIHIIFIWNTELHLNYISQHYPEDSFLAGCHRVIEIEGKVIEVALDTAKWTKVMDGQWEIHPAQPMVTKAALDDFKPGRGIPNCVLKARPLCEDFPELLHQVILNGIKPPQHKVILSYMPSRMTRDPTSDHVQWLRAPASQVDVPPQPLIFSKDMSYEQLAVWLTNHPQFMGADYQQDISKLKDARINGYVFLNLNESTLSQFGISFGFKFAIMNIIKDMKMSQQPTKTGVSVHQQPQSPATARTPALAQVDLYSQSLTFSNCKDMSYKQLAVWLGNHPSLSGGDYEEDISKLRDARINGHIFLSLNERRLERFNVSVGFQFAITNIIEDMKSSQGPTNSDRQATDSAASSRTQHHPTYSADKKEKLKPNIGSCLGPSDLRRVQDSLWEARTQWYNLGLGLDITSDSLDSIELANAGNPERCFRAMLTKWLREHQRPTWSALAEALRSPSVGLSHLAEEINL